MKKIIIGILIIIEIGLIMVNYNTTLSNKEIERIETKEETKEIKGNNTLAIMLKGKEDDKYTPSETKTWPESPYKYAGALCIGNDGRDIEEDEVISFNNDSHTATITTKDTIYCYLYFAEGENAVDRIERLSGTALEDEQDVKAREDVLRRFQGTATDVQNNYICFGTSITEECVKNTDRYMYRIIGYAIDNDDTTNTKKGQLKLIKKEPLEEPMQWHYNYNDNVNWFQSDLYKRISTSAYLQNSYYVPSEWESKIADHTWWTGDIIHSANGTRQSGEEVFKIENGKKNTEYYELNMESGNLSITVNKGTEGDPYYYQTIKYDKVNQTWSIHQSAKVGIMSLSDYYLSQGKNITCSTNCRNGWMHISNNASNSYEWIMARYGLVPDWGLYDVFVANSSGAPTSWHPTSVYAVRPILYLESSVALNGSGTAEDPFIII